MHTGTDGKHGDGIAFGAGSQDSFSTVRLRPEMVVCLTSGFMDGNFQAPAPRDFLNAYGQLKAATGQLTCKTIRLQVQVN